MRFAIAGMYAVCAGCGELPGSTEPDCSAGELTAELAYYDPPNELLLIVEPELAQRLRPRLLALLRAAMTGEIDDESGQDIWVSSQARIGAITPRRAVELIQRVEWMNDPANPSTGSSETYQAVPFVRYRHAPYGYADDADELAERVLCLLGPDPLRCASEPEPDEQPFATWAAWTVLVSARDACDPFGDEQDCDSTLRTLADAWPSGWTRSIHWWPTLIAGAPVELTTLEAFDEAEDRGAYLRRLASDPRMTGPRDADACEGQGELTAQPARELVRALGDEGDGVISICADDYRPVLQMVECRAAVDYGGFGLERGRIALRPDGLAECDFDEVLPVTGPITRCAQLADFGRAAEPVAIERGHEVCRLQQLSAADGRAGNGYGWYLADGSEDSPDNARLRPYCSGFIGGPGVNPTYGAGTARVPSSTIRVRCATVAGAPDIPRCDGGADAAR